MGWDKKNSEYKMTAVKSSVPSNHTPAAAKQAFVTRCLSTQMSQSCLLQRPYPLPGMPCELVDWVSSLKMVWTQALPYPKSFFFFFSAGCHYPAALFSLLLLSCSVCCYLTQISTDCICFCWKFFKISYDDKILFCVLKSEYQTVGS